MFFALNSGSDDNWGDARKKSRKSDDFMAWRGEMRCAWRWKRNAWRMFMMDLKGELEMNWILIWGNFKKNFIECKIENKC